MSTLPKKRRCSRRSFSTTRTINMWPRRQWSKIWFVINRTRPGQRNPKSYSIRKWRQDNRCTRKCREKNKNGSITRLPYSKWKWRSLNWSRDWRIPKWCSRRHFKSWRTLCRRIQMRHNNKDHRINQKKLEMGSEVTQIFIPEVSLKFCLYPR